MVCPTAHHGGMTGSVFPSCEVWRVLSNTSDEGIVTRGSFGGEIGGNGCGRGVSGAARKAVAGCQNRWSSFCWRQMPFFLGGDAHGRKWLRIYSCYCRFWLVTAAAPLALYLRKSLQRPVWVALPAPPPPYTRWSSRTVQVCRGVGLRGHHLSGGGGGLHSKERSRSERL